MKFRLDYNPPACPEKIAHRHSLFLAGSCFAENIGRKLLDHRFSCTVNPGGIHFDPMAMCTYLRRSLAGEAPSGDQILERDGRYFSFAHHSSIQAPSEKELLSVLQTIYSDTREALLRADFIFLSFGTAFVRYLNSNGLPVANCHKQPAGDFAKRLSGIEELLTECRELNAAIQKENSNARIIVTVSPVKYLRDGVVNNNISKSTLLLLASRLTAEDSCFYFPAFELLNDDLRDYRFYKEDLAHPNELAINYIWEKFCETFFSPRTKEVVGQIGKLNDSLAHKPLQQLPREEASLKESIRRQKEIILGLDPSVRL